MEYLWRSFNRTVPRLRCNFVPRRGQGDCSPTDALVFEELPVKLLKQPATDLEAFASQTQVDVLIDKHIVELAQFLDKFYPNAMIPTLFKNLSKCENLAEKVRKASRNLEKSE